MSPVDACVERSVPPEHQNTQALFRARVRETTSDAEERVSCGLPMWKQQGYLAHVSPSKQGITFGFPYGAAFVDPHGIVRGGTRHARYVRIKRAPNVDPAALRDYIMQDVAADAQVPAEL